MMDYEMGRESFVDMGEMMLRFIYDVSVSTKLTSIQMNMGWQEFLGFYTGINIQRKNYDEKYEKETGIGEETEDPVEEDLSED